jgi:hypothetical protein
MSLPKEGRNNQTVPGNVFPTAGRFSDAIAAALHRQYGDTQGAIKTVVGVTGATERTVKNWFQAKNGPNGEFLIRLCRHSDHVLETILLLSGRDRQVKAKKIGEMQSVLRQMLILLSELDSDPRR